MAGNKEILGRLYAEAIDRRNRCSWTWSGSATARSSHWGVSDGGAMMRQLGAAPPPA